MKQNKIECRRYWGNKWDPIHTVKAVGLGLAILLGGITMYTKNAKSEKYMTAIEQMQEQRWQENCEFNNDNGLERTTRPTYYYLK